MNLEEQSNLNIRKIHPRKIPVDWYLFFSRLKSIIPLELFSPLKSTEIYFPAGSKMNSSWKWNWEVNPTLYWIYKDSAIFRSQKVKEIIFQQNRKLISADLNPLTAHFEKCLIPSFCERLNVCSMASFHFKDISSLLTSIYWQPYHHMPSPQHTTTLPIIYSSIIIFLLSILSKIKFTIHHLLQEDIFIKSWFL